MITVNLLLMLLAVICFLIAAINIQPQRINLIAAGLFFWSLAVIIKPT